MRTVVGIVKSLPSLTHLPPLPTPAYTGTSGEPRVGLVVPSMRHHSTNEGWELFLALQAGGYHLIGRGMPICGFETDIAGIIGRLSPGTVVLQDKREWEGKTAGPGFNPNERFTNVGVLWDRHNVFKLTVLKDAHQDPAYHRVSADEIGCHAWVVYYHPDIVHRLAPWTRREHLIRTYHTVDPGLVPAYSPDGRGDALLSGAITPLTYPLRNRIREAARVGFLSMITVLPHPGYTRNHCFTPEYLRTLSHHKVAVCTSSVYGYALRKIIEATACGCMVLTDLPVDDVLPEIDGNLWRVDPDTQMDELGKRLSWMAKHYDPATSRIFAERALERYSYMVEGKRLAGEIEALRQNYGRGT